MRGLSRRRLLGLAATAAVARLLPLPAAAAPSAPPIVRRSTWGPDLVPTGPLQREEDVRFLLVHHTADANGYAADEVVDRLRGYVRFHTESRGWADLAYNFLVDAYGVAYEGRTGSVDGPVRGDATGGSQGHAILCAFIGDHSVEPPTEAAQQTMIALLAWQAGLHGLDPRDAVTFTSRGSNLHPAGSQVTTTVIAGHRDMSLTTCPGDAAYELVRTAFPDRVAAFLAAGAPGAPAGTPPSVEVEAVPTPTP
ncbi:MAG: N-acetylmuramoyl-L-alanine amidase, partial [Actinobacteria bacterium]|nr:N-acetylmuramoyl-L-alanine amidase [Actinomycetota bacterium]